MNTTADAATAIEHDTPDSLTYNAYFYAWLYWSDRARELSQAGKHDDALTAYNLANRYYRVHALRTGIEGDWSDTDA